MKKFSELIGVQRPTYITEANDRGVSLADKLLAQPIPKQPDFMVGDNPKMMQLADTFIRLINKRCDWNGFTMPCIMEIGGVQTIVILNKNVEGEAVSISPAQNGGSTTIRYFLNFNAALNNQEAEYTISSKNMGVVKMFEFLFSVIKNPSAYTQGMYESKRNGGFGMLNESRVGEDDTFYNAYADAHLNNSVYKALLRWSKNPERENPETKPKQIGNLTWSSIEDTIEFMRANKDKLPNEGCVFAEQLATKTGFGKEVAEHLKGADGKLMVVRGAGAAAFARFLYEVVGVKREGDVTFNIGENVDITNETAQEYTDTYKGLDISFARYFWGRNIDEFKKLVDEYFDDIEDLTFRIEELVKYAHMTRLEKLKNLHIGDVGIIISGSPGIGKSDAWNQVRKKLNLVKGEDYAIRDNGSCNASELYKFIYSNNGKLLVLDDTPNLFDSEFQVSLWKKVLDPGDSFPEMESPSGQALGEGTKGIFYSLASCKEGGVENSKKRYFKECPNIEKTIRRNSKITDDEEENIKTKITMVPDRMTITSRFLIITNAKDAEMEKAMGDHWKAVRDRSYFKRLDPPKEVVWARIKQKLLEVKETNDQTWFIPPQYVDEVIELVENEFSEFGCDTLTWRAFTKGTLAQDFLHNRNWKKTILSQITTRVSINDTLDDRRRARRKSLKGF